MKRHDGVIRVRVFLLSWLALAALTPLAALAQGWGTAPETGKPAPSTYSGMGGMSYAPPLPMGRPWGEVPPEFNAADPVGGIPERRQKTYSEYLWEREYYRRFGKMPDTGQTQEKVPEVMEPPPAAQPPPVTGRGGYELPPRDPWDPRSTWEGMGPESGAPPVVDPRWREQWPPYGGVGPGQGDPRWPPPGGEYQRGR